MPTEGKDTDLKIVKNSSYTMLCPVGMATESKDYLNGLLLELVDETAQDVVVNCEQVQDLSTPWVRFLMQLHQKLKIKNKNIRLIGVNNFVLKHLKQEGVDTSLRTAETLSAALADMAGGCAVKLDVKFINPFLVATMKVLETQTSMVAKPGKVYTLSPKEKFLGDISGVIGLVADAFSGSVVISFPAKTFLQIMSRMLGEEFTQITSEIEDGAGELTNIIFGQAKMLLNEQGYGIKNAIPSVISGTGHSVSAISSGPRVVVPFESDAGPFYIEICLSTQSGKN